jgi:Uma2 family endonuclease
MSAEITSEQALPPWEIHDWVTPPPTDLIFDDGEPLETNRHRIAMNVLIDSALSAPKDRSDSFVGGNMFVYYSRNQKMNRDFRGPDFFAVLNVDGSRERKGWVVWEEDGRYPDVIVEFMSPSTAKIDTGIKKTLYSETFHTANYFVYDPFDSNSLQGWYLDSAQRYQSLSPNDRGWLWCEKLGLWLGTWEGSIRREPPSGTCHWLRFYDEAGQLIPLFEEAAQQQAEEERLRAEAARLQAEEERSRAERLAERLRSLGIDPSEV